MKNIFFQSSMPRAGSTLLQNIIGQRPDFYVTPTSGLLELIFAARSNYTNSPEFKAQDDLLMKKAFFGFCGEGMKGYFNNITDKDYVMDKSRGWAIHYPLLKEIWDNPKIICIVRDLRSVIASMEKLYRKNFDKNNPIINHSNLDGTTIHKRAENWLNSIPVGLALDRMLDIYQQKINENIHILRYEDLMLNPQAEMDKIYEYLKIDGFNHDFNNIQQITLEDDSVYGVYGNHNIQKSLSSKKDDFKDVLGSYVCSFIKEKYKWYFDVFNYT